MTKNTHVAAVACGMVFAVAALAPALSYAATFGNTNVGVSSNNLNVNDGACLIVTVPSDYAVTNSISGYFTGSGSVNLAIWGVVAGQPTGSPLTVDSIPSITGGWNTATDTFALTPGNQYCVGYQSQGTGPFYAYDGPNGGAFYALTGTSPISSSCNTGSCGAGTLGSFYVTYTSGSSTPPQATSTVQIIENPDQVLAYGIFMFFIAFFGMVWLMRKH